MEGRSPARGSSRLFIGNVSRGIMVRTTSLDAAATLHEMANRPRNASVKGTVAELAAIGNIAKRAGYYANLAGKWGLV